MQDVLKQKNKIKKPKTFGAVNNAYEIYHLVHKAITEDFMIDKYFHMIYDNIVQINNRCYVLTTK